MALAAWHGVLLRAKVERRGDAPAMFARTLPVLLAGQARLPAGSQAGIDRRTSIG